jgi:hypothetical protein
MILSYPSGTSTKLPIGFLEAMPRKFHPPFTQYTNTALAIYTMNLKAAMKSTADELDALKDAYDDPDWLIAVDACKYHLQSREIDEFDSSLDYVYELIDVHQENMDADTYELLKMYVDEWDDRIEMYKYCSEFINYLEYAVNERCIAQIYFTPN